MKGEPISTAMIILAMVGAGGALTMAAGKGGGFLTVWPRYWRLGSSAIRWK